jgi:hypothetical protein
MLFESARLRMYPNFVNDHNPAASHTKPAGAGSRPDQPALAGFVLPAARFRLPACGAAGKAFRHTRSRRRPQPFQWVRSAAGWRAAGLKSSPMK